MNTRSSIAATLCGRLPCEMTTVATPRRTANLRPPGYEQGEPCLRQPDLPGHHPSCSPRRRCRSTQAFSHECPLLRLRIQARGQPVDAASKDRWVDQTGLEHGRREREVLLPIRHESGHNAVVLLQKRRQSSFEACRRDPFHQVFLSEEEDKKHRDEGDDGHRK